MRTVPKTVLVLDDSEELRECMVLTLEDAGYHVLTAGGPDEALRVLGRRHVDAVVTDIIQQGRASGLDFITSVRSDFAAPVPPVIACSGFPDFASEARRRGAWAFLDKPFTTDDLQNAVAEALTGRQPAPEVVSQNAEKSRRFRRRAASEAEAFFRDLDFEHPGFRERANRAARWVSSYLGVQSAILVGLSDGGLTIEASSDEALLPPGYRLDRRLPLCRDVVETGARLLIPDLTAFSALTETRSYHPVRSFAAVPLLAPGGFAAGALCVLDDRPGELEVEDLTLLEQLGRRAAALLFSANAGSPVQAFFECGDLLSQDGFTELFGLELRRIRRVGGSLELALFGAARRCRDGAWLEAVSRVARGKRRALAAFDSERLGLFVTGPERGDAVRGVVGALSQLREHMGILSVGVVAVSGEDVPALNEHELLRVADALMKHTAPGLPTRVVIHAEPWCVAGDDPARASGLERG